MAVIHAKWTGDGIFRMEAALEKLSSGRRTAAVRRALNHTGDKTFTQVRRAVAKQMGVPQKALTSGGRALTRHRASGANLTYEIRSSGRAMRLKEVRWRKTRGGVTAYMWGEKYDFPSAFQIARWGGNFYKRKTSARFPIKALYGPNINKQLVKDESAAAFHRAIAELVPRVEHEVRVITDGVIS